MDARAALQEIFAFEQFRPGQEAAVSAALSDRDALVVMPTGSGKSLCYQLPALMRDDLTLVVSPLVSLMHDQAQALSQIAPGAVGLVNAQRAGAQNVETVAAATRGEIKLLYVAPERFAAPRFVEAIRRARVGLFVVDEAHCVSQWGHDFRPDYFALADAARSVGARTMIALTATATPQVAVDIVRRLELRNPVQITTGFDRPNLTFSVIPCATAVDKHQRIAAALSEPDALPAIVYAGTRRATDELAAELQATLGEEVIAYHAGLARDVRTQAQEQFMTGRARVIVATNAFGMGIDKANVRTVCHATVPGSLEAYYQEAGRAGRDGERAQCLLFAEQKDKGLHVFFIERARVDDAAFERVAERLRWAGLDGRYNLPLSELAGLIGARHEDESVRAIIGHLARAGMLRPEPSTPDRIAGQIAHEWDGRALAACRASARDAERARWTQYRAMWEYVERGRCRRRSLLSHLGDHSDPAPGPACCDVCDGPSHEWEARTFGARKRASGTRTAARPPQPLDDGDLDEAIVEIVLSAQPPVGRTRAVEILRGGRSKVIAEYSYDVLDGYGAFGHLRSTDVLGRVDELVAAGTLSSTGGRFPKLRASPRETPRAA
ncbi:MAG: RecQ family ATP-dependent DNA helicase [Solirubrobacteraceae bacterium]